jgi:hypothetical protein
MKMAVFWITAPCSLVVHQRLKGTCCLHHQGDEALWIKLSTQPFAYMFWGKIIKDLCQIIFTKLDYALHAKILLKIL